MPLLVAHLAVTWTLVGLIWVIQVLAYPQFLRVSAADFVGYHRAHCWRIGLLVTPLILGEGGTAALLWFLGHRETWFLMSLALLVTIWVSTALVQARLHTQLMDGYEAETIRRLIRTNWLRTVAWTLRGVLVSFLFVG